jgi:hypothetical protein
MEQRVFTNSVSGFFQYLDFEDGVSDFSESKGDLRVVRFFQGDLDSLGGFLCRLKTGV